MTEMNLVPAMNSAHGRLVLLAPPDAFIPEAFTGVEWNPQRHQALLGGLQRLRGRIYSDDGAVDPSRLAADGRFIQPADTSSWHIISLNGHNEVNGCARYKAHTREVRFGDTGAANSPLGRSPEWAGALRNAVESEIELAGRLGIDYVEVGGWALTPELRCTTEALRIALAAYSMARLLGGCIGLTTATRRHCSSSILRRIGGQPLKSHGTEIPPYFDPQYDCRMEILRFHSAIPNPRFEPWIQALTDYLSAVPVIRGVVHSDSRLLLEPAMNAA